MSRPAATLYGTQMPDFRPARPDELTDCARIWRTSINDYTGRLNQPEIPDDLTSIVQLYEHLQAGDPDRFVVATRPDEARGDERIVAFTSAVVRPPLWFLSMLFVLPEEQGTGIGRMLLERVLTAGSEVSVHGTATDSAQPVSNALYARFGMVPRMPLLHLIGNVTRPDALPDLPAGVSPLPFGGVAGVSADSSPRGPGGDEPELAATIAALDRELAGFEHPQDHRFLRAADRRGFVYRSKDGTALGYGYTSELGRVGPVAVRDADLMGPVLGHLLRAVRPRGAFAAWVPGHADRALRMLLGAGLRLEGFPPLLCWDRPIADFSRYLPISPGLL